MLAYLYVLIAVAIRLLAGTGAFATLGFTPVGASLLFFGSRMPRKQFAVPVAMLIASDLYLNLKVYGIPIHWDQIVVWAWWAGACFLGVVLRGRVKPLNVLGAAVANSVAFYVIVDFAVWAAGSVGYPKTFAGLVACYVAAIPFSWRMLVSDLLFSTILFSIPVLISLSRGALEGKTDKDVAR